MQIKAFRATRPDFAKLPTPPDAFFDDVKEHFDAQRKSGLFALEAEPAAMYIYRIQTEVGSHTGIVACADVRDYLEQNILRHEQTLGEKEKHQAALFELRQALIKPVLLTHPPTPQIHTFIENYVAKNIVFCNIKIGNEKHQFWQIKDNKNIQILQLLFQQYLPQAFIADGHHRIITAATRYQRDKTELYAQFMAAFFASDQLKVLPFYRIVKLDDDFSAYVFLEKLALVCDITKIDYASSPSSPNHLMMYMGKQWYELIWKDSILATSDKINDNLDVTLLNQHIITPLLGVQKIIDSSKITYVEGNKKLSEIVSKVNLGSKSVAFCLYPLDISDMLRVAASKQTLPPKSTCFEPRMKNGLLVQTFLE